MSSHITLRVSPYRGEKIMIREKVTYPSSKEEVALREHKYIVPEQQGSVERVSKYIS